MLKKMATTTIEALYITWLETSFSVNILSQIGSQLFQERIVFLAFLKLSRSIPAGRDAVKWRNSTE